MGIFSFSWFDVVCHDVPITVIDVKLVGFEIRFVADSSERWRRAVYLIMFSMNFGN